MKYLILIIISSIFNFISWNYFGVLFLVTLLILFYISNKFKDLSLIKKILILYFFYLCFNFSATFWLINVDFTDALLTYFTNSFLFLIFSFPLLLNKIKFRYFFFIVVWVFGEIILSKWDLAWPWLNYGNVLGNQWYFIQWYSYIGVYGGSIWLLVTSLIIFKLSLKQNINKNITVLVILNLFPVISFLNYYTDTTFINANKFEKITCYIPEKKYSNYTKTKKIYNYISKNNINNTVITTELFYLNVYSDYLVDSDVSFFYKDLFKKHENLNFIVGSEIINSTKIKFNGITYFNKKSTFFKTKKRYVPGTEFITPVLRNMFGETYYTKNNSDDTSEILKTINTIPFVCYESIFSDFVASFKSDKIIVLTSEAFLGDSTFGKKQYLNIQRIRAIENNKFLLKSSYKGFSVIINPKGNIVKKLDNGFNNISLPLIKTNSFYQKIIQILCKK